jgi:hypothetical protein
MWATPSATIFLVAFYWDIADILMFAYMYLDSVNYTIAKAIVVFVC